VKFVEYNILLWFKLICYLGNISWLS